MSETDKALREALGLLKGWGQQYGIELRSVEMQIPETQDFPRVHELEHITDEQTSTPRSSLTATLTVLRGWAEAHSIELQGVELRVSTKMQAHRFVHEAAKEAGKGLPGSEVGDLAAGYITGEQTILIAGLTTRVYWERDDMIDHLKGWE